MDINKIKNAMLKSLGKDIIYYKELESTQILAKDLIRDNKIKNNTLIITDNQTKGIGTKGRKWFSNEENNIAMSIVIFPKCNIEDIKDITIKIANCIVNAIDELYKIELKIKYPNDLLLNNKKICGILTESSSINNIVNHIVIGIGFNVNEIHFNDETISIATSLKKEFNKDFNREEIIIKIIENIEKDLSNIICFKKTGN
jgi:BirA family biotin operon repressor/biotin-[acetyl-CoA-carboxylase] ligase